jgi:hypothetical protein
MGEHVCNVSLQLRRRLAWLWFFAAARSDERDSSLFRGVACPLNKPETSGVESSRRSKFVVGIISHSFLSYTRSSA